MTHSTGEESATPYPSSGPAPSSCSIYSTHFAASLIGIQSVFVAPDEHPSIRSLLGKAVRITLRGEATVETGNNAPVTVYLSSNSGYGMSFSSLS